MNIWVETAPQLSEAVTITLNVPAGPAPAMVTTPFDWFTSKVPVKPAAEAEIPAIEPLSPGGESGVIVPPAPKLSEVLE
jgi:hypothetical protein